MRDNCRIVETCIHIHMAKNVNENARGGKWVYKWMYTYV